MPRFDGQAAAVTLNMQSTPGGIDLWFNSVAKVRGAQPGSHLYVSTGTMAFGATVVAVPAADISFTAAGTLSTTSFDPACNLWKISVPYTFGDNIFIAGLTYLLPNAIGNSTRGDVDGTLLDEHGRADPAMEGRGGGLPAAAFRRLPRARREDAARHLGRCLSER